MDESTDDDESFYLQESYGKIYNVMINITVNQRLK